MLTDVLDKLDIKTDSYSKFEELDIIKDYKDEYMKLLVLIKYMCQHKNDIDLMYKIYNNVNKIDDLFMKKVYLLYSYLKYSKKCSLYILEYIGISDKLISSIIDCNLGYYLNLIIERFNYHISDTMNDQMNYLNDKKDIDYNLKHLPKQQKMNKVIYIKSNIRRKRYEKYKDR